MLRNITVAILLLAGTTVAMAAEFTEPGAGFVSTKTRAEVKAELAKDHSSKMPIQSRYVG